MTEHRDKVIRHAMLLEAQDWAVGVSQIHVHSLSSMAYDEWPEDTENGSVTDTHYNNGTIKRTRQGNVIRVIGDELQGEALINQWSRANQSKAEILEQL